MPIGGIRGGGGGVCGGEGGYGRGVCARGFLLLAGKCFGASRAGAGAFLEGGVGGGGGRFGEGRLGVLDGVVGIVGGTVRSRAIDGCEVTVVG